MPISSSRPATAFKASDGDGYERQMGRWSRRLAPLFLDFAGVESARRVLDVGCGTGSLSLALAEYAPRIEVQGIDPSAVYVAHASARSPDPRLRFQVGDVRELPYSDAYFDSTLAQLVLQFVPEADKAIREMCRVTRPGGTVAAATWDTRGGLVASRLIFDTAALIDPGGHDRRARVYTRPLSRPGELAAAWRNAGLIDVADGMLTIRMDFASFSDFWSPAEGADGPVAEYVMSLPVETRTRLRAAVELAYLDGEVDGPRSLAATAWVVRGRVSHLDIPRSGGR